VPFPFRGRRCEKAFFPLRCVQGHSRFFKLLVYLSRIQRVPRGSVFTSNVESVGSYRELGYAIAACTSARRSRHAYGLDEST
jgi:hypothetical protein